MQIKVMLVDDHLMIIDGIKAILARETSIEIVGHAENGRIAIERIGDIKPDVVLMDVNMPVMNGIEATQIVSERYPEVRVLMISADYDRLTLVSALKAGARGYLVKNCSVSELASAIRSVAKGKSYLCAEVTTVLVEDYLARMPDRPELPVDLSPREIEVLRLVADGKSNKEIAFIFEVSSKTIEIQRLNIMKKLNIFNIAGLTKYAVRHGLSLLNSKC